MAGLMDNLTALLTSECEAYEKLVKVSSQKTQTIIDGDIEKLQKITMQEYEDYMNSFIFIDPDSEKARPAP